MTPATVLLAWPFAAIVGAVAFGHLNLREHHEIAPSDGATKSGPSPSPTRGGPRRPGSCPKLRRPAPSVPLNGALLVRG